MKNKVDVKLCGVCGDRALGYNFNAVTCESCKAFFRRNAVLQKDFKCPFNDQCEITTITRRFCQKCRLDKCFAIGMCKDLIMSEEDKVLKRRKIEENRAKKRVSTTFKKNFKKMKRESIDDSQTSSEEHSKDDFPNSHSSSTDFNVSSPTEKIVSSSEDVSVIRTTSSNNNNNNNTLLDSTRQEDIKENVTKPSAEKLSSMPAEANLIESILCEAIKLEFETYSSMGPNSNSKELNDAERAKLNELIVANKALLKWDEELGVADDCKLKNPKKAIETDPSIVDLINLTAVVIRRLIKMAKKVNAFKNMCQEDQVALLKGGCTEIMILRSAMNYDPTKQTWMIPRNAETFNLNLDVLKLAKGKIYQEFDKFMRTFDPKWRYDENIVLILCAITLFTPDRPKVVHQDVIKLEQNSYYYLLRRYLESIFPGCEAKSTFLKLIQKIGELHKLNEELIHVYLDVNPSEVEPLLIEIFDLKH